MAPEDVEVSRLTSLSASGQDLDETSLERQQQLKAESAELAEDCRFQEAMEKLSEAHLKRHLQRIFSPSRRLPWDAPLR